MVALALTAVAAGIACSPENDLVAPSGETGSDIISGSEMPGWDYISTQCSNKSSLPAAQYQLNIQCSEMLSFGTGPMTVGSSREIMCRGWGPPWDPSNGIAIQTPAVGYGQYHWITEAGPTVYWTTSPQQGPAFRTTMKALRPTNPGAPLEVKCHFGNTSNASIVVNGTAPALKSVRIETPNSKLGINATVDLIPHFMDTYDFEDMLVPVPTHGWTSLSPAVAEVNASTGRVTGKSAGTATIRLTSGSFTATTSITVVGCSINATPNAPINLVRGGAGATITGTKSCSQFAQDPWIWSSTDPTRVTVAGIGSTKHSGTVTPVAPGSADVTVCAKIFLSQTQFCSAPIRVNVAATGVTSAQDGVTTSLVLNEFSTASFVVTNIGAGPGTFNFGCTATGQMTCVSTVSPASATLAAGQSVPVQVIVRAGTGTGAGTIKLSSSDGGFDVVNYQVTNVTGEPLAAVIDDYPNPVRAGASCTWNVTASGGALPYTYAWTVNGNPAGTGGSSLTYVNGGASFTIGITVTDQVGAQTTAYKAIDVIANHPAPCEY